MDYNDYNDIGLFKFGIIAPAINKSHNFSNNESFFDEVSKKHIHSKIRNISFLKIQ